MSSLPGTISSLHRPFFLIQSFLKTMFTGLKPQTLTFSLLTFLVNCPLNFKLYFLFFLRFRRLMFDLVAGVRKEEIKVEVEDSKYLIIRTEAVDESTIPGRSFMRKFRLPGMINIDEISAGYEDGVLTVMAPRSITRRGLLIDPAAVPERLEVLARAA